MSDSNQKAAPPRSLDDLRREIARLSEEVAQLKALSDHAHEHWATQGKRAETAEALNTTLRDRVTAATAFARLVELLLDEAQDTLGAMARRTGTPRLADMTREAAKLCAVARDLQSPVTGPTSDEAPGTASESEPV